MSKSPFGEEVLPGMWAKPVRNWGIRRPDGEVVHAFNWDSDWEAWSEYESFIRRAYSVYGVGSEGFDLVYVDRVGEFALQSDWADAVRPVMPVV